MHGNESSLRVSNPGNKAEVRSILSRIADYTRVEAPLTEFEVFPEYVVVEEDLERSTDFGVVLTRATNARTGTVLKISPEVTYLSVGDTVLFEEWQGGRWSFLDSARLEGIAKCLILSKEDILARIE